MIGSDGPFSLREQNIPCLSLRGRKVIHHHIGAAHRHPIQLAQGARIRADGVEMDTRAQPFAREKGRAAVGGGADHICCFHRGPHIAQGRHRDAQLGAHRGAEAGVTAACGCHYIDLTDRTHRAHGHQLWPCLCARAKQGHGGSIGPRQQARGNTRGRTGAHRGQVFSIHQRDRRAGARIVQQEQPLNGRLPITRGITAVDGDNLDGQHPIPRRHTIYPTHKGGHREMQATVRGNGRSGALRHHHIPRCQVAKSLLHCINRCGHCQETFNVTARKNEHGRIIYLPSVSLEWLQVVGLVRALSIRSTHL